MITKFSSWLLFISSYIPLFLIFSINNIFKYFESKNSKNPSSFNLKISVFFLAVIFISLIMLFIILKLTKTSTNIVEVKSIKKSNGDVINYLFVYIVPFISIDTSNFKDLIIFAILFLVIGIISVENNLIYINPTLYILKYNIYKLNDQYMMISKDNEVKIKRAVNIKVSVLSNDVYIHHKDKLKKTPY